MKTKHAAYSLYRKKVGERQFWYVRFWDKNARKYSAHRATGIEVSGKKGRKGEAEAAAAKLLPAVIFDATHMTLLQYVKAFWNEDSPYFRERAQVKKKPPSAYYIKAGQDIVRLHLEKYPPFKNLPFYQLSPALIRDFMLWEAERGFSGIRINRALQVLRVPVRYAVERDEMRVDPFTKVKPAAVEWKEKGILTRAEFKRLVELPAGNARHRLAVCLGLLCGMRRGEVRGLHWEDIDWESGVINIRHNWQDMEGVKGPKYDSKRDVPVVREVAELLARCHEECGKPASGLVFARKKDGKPFCNGYFRIALIRELTAIGIKGNWTSRKPAPDDWVNEQAERRLSFHSLRHTFITMSLLAKINEVEVQALAGHKSRQMLNRYTHPSQTVDMDGCRKALECVAHGGGLEN